MEDGLCIAANPTAGVYAVEGEYTFSASPGGSYSVGYRLQDWDEATGRWTNSRFVNGTAYTYNASTATAAKQRIYWCKSRGFMLIIR